MEINGIKIIAPEGMEAYQENDTVKFRKIGEVNNYEDVAKILFKDNIIPVIDDCDSKGITIRMVKDEYNYPVCCTSEKQAKKLLAINKLMNVAKYLNTVSKVSSTKYFYIYIDCNQLCIGRLRDISHMDIWFNDIELAEKAIKILGEDTIKLALSKDY